MAENKLPRRDFLKAATAAGAATAAAATGIAACNPEQKTAATQAAPAESDARLVLTSEEVAFLTAAVDTIIPKDELSPSGSECGCVTFIDRQLASAWGGGAKMYRSGPFQAGTPEQGYQMSLTPHQFFVAGIRAANEWSQKTNGKSFDALPEDKRVEALKAMEEGKAEFENFSSRAFFSQLHGISMAGFFSDPIYGGNRDKIGWKVLGFPGLPATYADKIDAWRGKRYVADPQSIADFS